MGRTTFWDRGGVVVLFLLMLGMVSCDPVDEIRRIDLGDVRPPMLANRVIQTDGLITLEFDELVSLRANSLFLNGTEHEVSVRGQSIAPDTKLVLEIEGNTIPGRPYSLELAVEDTCKNSLNIVMPFYGPNPSAAGLVLNELMTQSSTKNRDAVEVLVTRSGNVGGITLFLGVPDDFDAAYIFPACEVRTGDYLIVHCKPEGVPEEKDETGADLGASGGKNASALARDLWWGDAPGLPDSTGIVTLASSPIGLISDGLFYSDKVSVPGKEYRSFGTKKLLDRAEKLQAAGAWICSGAKIAVEDAAQSGFATATRTLCRAVVGTTGGRAREWYIVSSGLASIGTTNNEERYDPEAKVSTRSKAKAKESKTARKT